MLTESLTISGIRITGLSYSLKEGLISSRLTITSRMDVPLARALGCDDLLFLDNGAPKEGFARLDLDTCCERYRASFECLDPELKQTFQIDGHSCDGFCVERLEEGVFRLRFRLHHTGNLHGPLAFLEQIGTAQSRLRLTPIQTGSLSAAEPETGDEGTTPRRDGSSRSVPVEVAANQEHADELNDGSAETRTRRRSSRSKGQRRVVAMDSI